MSDNKADSTYANIHPDKQDIERFFGPPVPASPGSTNGAVIRTKGAAKEVMNNTEDSRRGDMTGLDTEVTHDFEKNQASSVDGGSAEHGGTAILNAIKGQRLVWTVLTRPACACRKDFASCGACGMDWAQQTNAPSCDIAGENGDDANGGDGSWQLQGDRAATPTLHSFGPQWWKLLAKGMPHRPRPRTHTACQHLPPPLGRTARHRGAPTPTNL